MHERHKTILELEALALLCALKKYQPFIKHARTFVIVDNRSLFWLFSETINDANSKVSRYALKLKNDYPQVRVFWTGTMENVADIFSRMRKSTLLD